MEDKRRDEEKQGISPLFRFFLLVILFMGMVFIFYGIIESNFGYPPLEEIPERSYRTELTGTPGASVATGVNTDKLKSTWSLPHEMSQPGDFISQLEQRIWQKTNEQRKRRELPPLKGEQGLSRTARYHSSDMGQNNFFDHQNLENIGPSFRRAKIHRKYIGTVGENIFKMTKNSDNSEEIAKTIMRGWMDSTGHRKNILHEPYNVLGVGCFEIMNNNQPFIYATQVFGKKIGNLSEDFPHQAKPSQPLSIRVKIIDPEYLAPVSVSIINVKNRRAAGTFSLTPNTNNETVSAGTLEAPSVESIYQLEFRVPYVNNKNTLGIFRGPLFSVEKEK